MMLKALADCRIAHLYTAPINHIYKNATASVRLYNNTNKCPIGRGVCQGDTISPKTLQHFIAIQLKKFQIFF